MTDSETDPASDEGASDPGEETVDSDEGASEPNEGETAVESEEQSNSTTTGGSTASTDSTSSSGGTGIMSMLQTDAGGAVGVMEGIRYGASLLVYLVAVGAIAGLLTMVSTAVLVVATGSESIIVQLIVGFFSLLFWFLAFLVYTAGFAGLLYKIIADGVSRGMQ